MLVKWWFPNFACGAWEMVVGGSGSMSAVVPCAVVIPQMTGFESKAWLVLPLPCVGSPLCPCSEGNGFRGMNLLSVSWSGAEQIAGLKSPTTHCYKSIKHLQLTIEPPASAAEHVNSCDQITAQLTAFTCAPTVPISKGEILAEFCPMGSWTVTRTRLFGRLDGHPAALGLPGHGQRVCGQREPGDSGTSGCPLSSSPAHPVRASGCRGRLSQDLIPMELGNTAHLAWPAVFWRAPPHSPTTPVREKTAFIFLLRGCGQIVFRAEQCFEGRGVSPAAPGRAGPKGLWGAGRAWDTEAASPRAGTPRLRRRRRSVFALAAAANGPLAAGQALMFPLALVRRGIQENNRERWGLSRSGGAGQRSPAWGTAASRLRGGAGGRALFRRLLWNEKNPHRGGAMGIKSVREAGRRLPKMSAMPRKSYGTQTNKDRNAQITCRLHYLGHSSNKREHKETWQVPPYTDTTTPIVMEPARCWECPFTALGMHETLQDPDFPRRSEPGGRTGHKRAMTRSWYLGNSVWPGETPEEFISPR